MKLNLVCLLQNINLNLVQVLDNYQNLVRTRRKESRLDYLATIIEALGDFRYFLILGIHYGFYYGY